ncbi:MAG: hypothetical protein DHS20C20_22610 [Ardenticatenaceae bacterium]|nr:MAG: hypothetical protein DHS20C20_22610 [Ardenticatenaceae bacterium]
MTRPVPPQTRARYRQRAPLMILAAVALLAGLWAGLLRLGWQLPPLLLRLPAQHGPLMVSGFLGSLISLERAVALSQYQGGRRLYYLAPLLAGLGALALFFVLPTAVPRGLSTLGALGLVLIFVIIYRLQPTTDHAVMGIGALLWLVGNGLWLAGWPIFRVAPWWAGFLILTIAGERLELGRVLLHKRQTQHAFLAVTAVFLAGLLLSLVAFDSGVRLAGLGLIALGVWLLRYDIARRTIRQKGLTRFIAACLLPGYVWLMVGGLFWLGYGGQYVAGPVYDALLHTLFLGFVFSMIFGHAPVIVPAVLGVQVPYTPIFYLHLGLLHLSLVLRVVGDGLLSFPLRRWGGLLNEVAVLLFLLVTAVAARRGKKNEKSGSQ